jgi:hypothetical protein
VEILADYDLDIRYKAGKENVVADALSRRPDHLTANGISIAAVQPDTRNNIKAAYETHDLVNDPGTKDPRFSHRDDMWTYDEKLYIPDLPHIRPRLLSEYYDTPVHGHRHMGVHETHAAIQRIYDL